MFVICKTWVYVNTLLFYDKDTNVVMTVTISAWKRCSIRLCHRLFLGMGCVCLTGVRYVCLRVVVSYTYCFLFLLCISSSCVSYVVASFSGLSIWDCPFCFLSRLFPKNTPMCVTCTYRNPVLQKTYMFSKHLIGSAESSENA